METLVPEEGQGGVERQEEDVNDCPPDGPEIGCVPGKDVGDDAERVVEDYAEDERKELPQVGLLESGEVPLHGDDGEEEEYHLHRYDHRSGLPLAHRVDYAVPD